MDWLENRLVTGAIAGLLSAAAVDVSAFRSWKTLDEALRYDWKLAAWRWGQGAIAGALAGLGLSGLT